MGRTPLNLFNSLFLLQNDMRATFGLAYHLLQKSHPFAARLFPPGQRAPHEPAMQVERARHHPQPLGFAPLFCIHLQLPVQK